MPPHTGAFFIYLLPSPIVHTQITFQINCVHTGASCRLCIGGGLRLGSELSKMQICHHARPLFTSTQNLSVALQCFHIIDETGS
jgi:hypothetical protein